MNNDPGKIHLADKELSQLYESLPAPEPDEATDEAILHFAKQRTLVKQVPVRKIKVNWTGGFSVAASVLAVSILYWTQFAPSEDVANQPIQEGFIASDSAASIAPLAETSLAMPTDASQPQSSIDLKHAARTYADSALVEQVSASATQLKVSQESIEDRRFEVAAGEFESIAVESVAVDRVEADSLSLDSLQTENEKSASDIVKSIKSRLNAGVRLTAKCRVSVDSGYRLSNTPLASFTKKWSNVDKVWLTEQLNGFKPLAFILDDYQGNNVAVLQVPGFDTAYQQTLESLKNCKQQPPVSVEK